MAYRPGMTQFRSPLHAAKAGLWGYENCSHWMRMPTMRPAHAPTTRQDETFVSAARTQRNAHYEDGEEGTYLQASG